MRALVWKKENHKIWHWIPYGNYYHMILILLTELIEFKDFQWKHGAKIIIFCFCSCLGYINITETFFVMYDDGTSGYLLTHIAGLQNLRAQDWTRIRRPNVIEESKISGALLSYVLSYYFLDTSLLYYWSLFWGN